MLEDLTWVLGPQLSPNNTKDKEQFENVCYHEQNHKFYTITNFSMVFSSDLNGQNVELICLNMPNPYNRMHQKLRLYVLYRVFVWNSSNNKEGD
ncbi:hypothetical protein MA16_Dca000838 [Dendrobium catenatum]|uniref:Uncharacterized protein n=1 Tax=Dendrobium catenatum TaxID=906689 RepID=A0A2I0WV08_9ASPA|nr:hypothetical protein MA16_Dca000838 [Dendrobium catenatum]